MGGDTHATIMAAFEQTFADPPREFSLLPFWFWNDELDAGELLRQIDDFEAHGVHGFVIHPRVGLPRDTGWMSDKLLGFYRVVIEAAARRCMTVLLYDEGMYPSGSSSGQVVQRWPDLACRCLARHDGPLPPGATRVAPGVIERPADSYIRGLHYVGDGPAEDEPRAGDILNPRTAAGVIELVYDKFHAAFGDHFGTTILGIFTDEPNPLGKCREADVFPYTPGLLPHVGRLLGRDINPADLWADPVAADDYRRAVRMRMDETWYRPLSDWCAAKGVALCGHPDAGDEIGVQRFFQIPGQDLVWRWVLPDHSSAMEGPESTQGKCSSSAMVHFGRRRNSNEFCGAYGHGATFDEVRWLANWCLIRGVNLLIPHAFYYSIRGPRRDERPPQLGPHTPQWDDGTFKAFADSCRRLSWLNTDCRHICDVAILTHDDRCPWPAAKALLTHQRDFNYLDPTTLLERATVDADGIRIGGMTYTVLVIDGEAPVTPALLDRLRPMIDSGAVVRYTAGACPDGLLVATSAGALAARAPARYVVEPAPEALRLRTIEKDGRTVLIAFNESGRSEIDVTLTARDGRLRGLGSNSRGAATVGLRIEPNDLVLLEVLPLSGPGIQ
jgi:hypothetical protein